MSARSATTGEVGPTSPIAMSQTSPVPTSSRFGDSPRSRRCCPIQAVVEVSWPLSSGCACRWRRISTSSRSSARTRSSTRGSSAARGSDVDVTRGSLRRAPRRPGRADAPHATEAAEAPGVQPSSRDRRRRTRSLLGGSSGLRGSMLPRTRSAVPHVVVEEVSPWSRVPSCRDVAVDRRAADGPGVEGHPRLHRAALAHHRAAGAVHRRDGGRAPGRRRPGQPGPRPGPRARGRRRSSAS